MPTLSAAQQSLLQESFQKLSLEWDQTAADYASSLLKDTRYSADVWQEFFNAYFVEHPLTWDLVIYLSYPTFSWYSDEVHRNLQLGRMIPTLSLIERSMNALTASSG